MATILNPPPSNNLINVYAYERFSYVISNPNPAVYTTLQPVSNTTGFGPSPSPLYFTKNGNSNITFASSDLSNNLTPGTTESFKVTVTDVCLNSLVSSNTVTINAGRFLDPSGVTLSNNSYTFFKNETITPIQLVAPSFTLATPTSIPALPPGLSFSNVAPNIFAIQGTPLVPVANSNYQIIGVQSGGSKIVTTRFNMVISNERLRVNLLGSSDISGMEIGTAITPRVITSIPPATGGSVRYTYPAFPDGIVVKDSSGNVQSGTSFVPALTDPSYTMIIEGTPTLAAAEAFRTAGAGSNGLPYTVTATRFTPLPALSNTVPLTFKFAETVLFDTPSLQPLYVGVPVDMTKNFFRAQTYFTTIVGISNIFSPDLRSDLSLIYTPGSARADLAGTPLTAGTATYTIRAINSNAKQRDLLATISVSNDTISFVSPTPVADTCYSFILSRPLTSFKPGFYESNIQFKATAASQLPVTLSAPALAGTGLSLDASGVIVGLPSQVTPLTTLTVTANAVGSPATGSRNIKFSILDDTFEFTDVCSNSLRFIENIPITPVRFPATTLSERNIIGYTQSGFPTGITINSAGVISGTPTSASPTAGNVTITATTGYASGSRDFSYSIIPDSILLTAPQSFYSYVAGGPVSIPITGTSYSGTTVSNYAITLPAPYGLAIGNTSGLISGTWTNSIPPNQLLPASLTFFVEGEVGDTSASSLVSLTASPVIQNTSFVWASGNLYSSNPTSSWTSNSNVTYTPAGFDIVIQNSNVDGNFILATASNTIYRSTNANEFTGVLVGGAANDDQIVSSLASKPDSTTWWASGTRVQGDAIRRANILQSDDNGVTWYQLSTLKSSSSPKEMIARDSNASSGTLSPYTNAGIALKYQDGVMMAGGGHGSMSVPAILRSTDDGATWYEVSDGFIVETAYFNLDVSGKWVATGSDAYRSGVDSTYTSSTNTIKYSTNAGQKWSNATGGFNMFGYELVYANNVWLASGIDCTVVSPTPQVFTYSLKYSTDASNWSTVSGIPTIDFSFNSVFVLPNARYNFNSYTFPSSLIASVGGIVLSPNATILQPGLNTYVTSDPANKHLRVFAINGSVFGSGGIRATLTSISSVEMWLKLDTFNNLQHFIDFRTAMNPGAAYMFSQGPGSFGFVSPTLVGQRIYYNTNEEVLTSTHNPVTRLYNKGWTQVVLVLNSPVTGSVTFLTSYLQQAGMPVNVAEIATYSNALTREQVRMIYESKRSRYGLPSIPIPLWAPLPIGSMNYDGSNWNVFTQTRDPSGTWVSKVYSAPNVSGSWTNVDVSFSQIPPSSGRRFVTYTRPQYLRPSDVRTINILLSFAGAIGGGPTISPSSSGFLLYQYVAMSLQLSAIGTGTIYFFISSTELPPGLTFDPITNIISGSPAQDGTFTTRVYAKDDNGVSLVTYTFTVNIPRIIRRQDGAGAYTSLLKQYTEVLAAQSARDSRALPAQETHLGEFMAPVPVAVTTKTFSTNCQNCLRQECAASNVIIDGNGSSSVVCDFIDANEGEVFDAGNAEGNICD